MVKFGKDM